MERSSLIKYGAIGDYKDNFAAYYQEFNFEENEEQFFKNGKFEPISLQNEILKENDIMYVPQLGIYIFNKYWNKVDEEFIAKLCKDKLMNRARKSYINETVDLIKKEVYIPFENLNINRNRLVLKNGTLDLSDWCNIRFYPNKYFKDDYCMIQLNCEYNEGAAAPVFQEFLSSTFEGDNELICLACEIIGYCLTSSIKHEKAFLFYGEGSNGKSIFINVIEKILTLKNISSVSLSDLDKPFSRSALQYKLVNISSEQEGFISDTAYLKKIVSGDIIDAQYKFKDQFEFRPYCKMVFATNNLPMSKDRTNGFYRRFITIPFNRIFKENEQDKELTGKLERELDGILQLALVGLKRLYENGKFTSSQKANKLLNQYKYENNPALQFFEENVVEDKMGQVFSDDLYKAYTTFCQGNGIRAMSSANFGKEIKSRYNITKSYVTIKELNIARKYVYNGIRLI